MMWPPSVLWLAAVVGLALFARAGTGVACSGTLSSASSSSSSSARYWSHVLTYYSVGKVRSCFGEFEVGGALHFFFFFHETFSLRSVRRPLVESQVVLQLETSVCGKIIWGHYQRFCLCFFLNPADFVGVRHGDVTFTYLCAVAQCLIVYMSQ